MINVTEIKLIKILQELTESEPKPYPKHQREIDKHIPTNNKITGDKPSQQFFSKQVANQPSLLNKTNRTHRSVKIKTFKN